jgi:hypothetical protein
MLKIVANPTHEEYDAMAEWAGNYDPERFDPAKVRFDNPQVRWQNAFSDDEQLTDWRD